MTNNRSLVISALILSLSLTGNTMAQDTDNSTQILLTDFADDDSDMGWFVLNDSVMGGKSEGYFSQERGELFFSGHTNTDGGGFSSIRTEVLSLDLSDHEGIRLRIKGDGRRYTWRLTSKEHWQGLAIGYWASFDTDASSWQTVSIPFSRFQPQVHGVTLDGPPLDSAAITGMGVMIYDNEDGPFELRIAHVSAYSADRLVSNDNGLLTTAIVTDD